MPWWCGLIGDFGDVDGLVILVMWTAAAGASSLVHPYTPSPATAGSVKGLTSAQLEALDCHVILGNTYHLENRPGSALVAGLGGLHGFINWPRGMLTDSGGFQVSMHLN